MKEYKFPDPDYEGWEITVPRDVVKDIIITYLQKTYYWAVGVGCFLIGLLVGIAI